VIRWKISKRTGIKTGFKTLILKLTQLRSRELNQKASKKLPLKLII